MNAPQISKEAGTEMVELVIRKGLTEKACDQIDKEVTELTRNMSLAVILSNKTREEAILALDTLLDAIQTDLRANGQRCVNDSFDSINAKVQKMRDEAAGPAIGAFNAVQRAKHTDEAK